MHVDNDAMCDINSCSGKYIAVKTSYSIVEFADKWQELLRPPSEKWDIVTSKPVSTRHFLAWSTSTMSIYKGCHFNRVRTPQPSRAAGYIHSQIRKGTGLNIDRPDQQQNRIPKTWPKCKMSSRTSCHRSFQKPHSYKKWMKWNEWKKYIRQNEIDT